MNNEIGPGLSSEERASARRAIESCIWFTCLDENQIANFVEVCLPKSYVHGGTVSVSNSLYIVAEGELEEFETTDRGVLRHIKTLVPGDIFGTEVMFGSHVGSTVLAKSGVKLLEVSRHSFQSKVLDSPRIRSVYESYASQVRGGKKVMDRRDLVRACSASSDPIAYHQIAALYNLFVSKKVTSIGQSYKLDALNEIVPYEDFAVFSLYLARPDPHFDIAFLLIDQGGKGYVTLGDVKQLMRDINLLPASLNAGKTVVFNFDCDLIRRFFGTDGAGRLREEQFSSFFTELQKETGRQSFLSLIHLRKRETLRSITGVDLCQLLLAHSGDHTAVVADRLSEALSSNGKNYFYGDFLAFQKLLSHMPVVCSVISEGLKAKGGDRLSAVVSKDDYKIACKLLLDPLQPRAEVESVFQLFDLDRDGFISAADLQKVLGAEHNRRLRAVRGRDNKLTLAPPPSYGAGASANFNEDGEFGTAAQPASVWQRFSHWFIEFMEHFAMGGVAGGIGSFAVYPIDLVKTRLQNQRSGKPKPLPDGSIPPHYRGALDCFQQVLRKEGLRGLYRGLGPQLVGVAPEKAIKITVNSLAREAFTNQDKIHDSNKGLYFPLEVLAGCLAGASQVMFTNPLEIVKIRLQVQGETESMLIAAGKEPPLRKSAMGIVRELGLGGLYKGSSACLLRDVPFSGIYFPCYAAMRAHFAAQTPDGNPKPHHLLIAGAIAGIPAAGLVTPADVIKTRLQVVARSGDQVYTGITDAFVKILQQEGVSGLYKGALMRVARSSPQFGVTLVSYELLHNNLAGPNSKAAPPTNAPVPWEDLDNYRRKSMEERTTSVLRTLKPFLGAAEKQ